MTDGQGQNLFIVPVGCWEPLLNLSLRTSFVKQSKLLIRHTNQYTCNPSFLFVSTHFRLPRPLPIHCLVIKQYLLGKGLAMTCGKLSRAKQPVPAKLDMSIFPFCLQSIIKSGIATPPFRMPKLVVVCQRGFAMTIKSVIARELATVAISHFVCLIDRYAAWVAPFNPTFGCWWVGYNQVCSCKCIMTPTHPTALFWENRGSQ